MTALYMFSLVLGGGLLLLSLFSGDGGEAELDVDGAAELDGADAKVFSLRSLIYAAFGFGATGMLLSRLGASSAVTAAAAVITGLVAGAGVTAVFNYLRRTESGSIQGDTALVGAAGRVVLPLSGETPGAVVVARGGREVRLRALPHPAGEGDPGTWARILVVEVEHGIARVVPVKGDTLLEP